MTREEITNSRVYRVANAACEWYEEHPDADVIDAFEAGAEWADEHQKDDPLEGILIHGNNDAYRLGYKKAVDKACEWLRANHDEIYLRYIRGYSAEDEIEIFKKHMEEQ